MCGLTREENRSGVTAAPALREWEVQPLPASGRLCPLPPAINLNQSLARAGRRRSRAPSIARNQPEIYSNIF